VIARNVAIWYTFEASAGSLDVDDHRETEGEMRRRKFLFDTSRSAIGLAVVPGFLRRQTSTDAPDAAPLIAELEKEIPRTMEDTRVPGMSIAIVRDAQLLWRRGFGVMRTGSNERVDNDTVFEAGSVSKTVFAYAVMKLCERGVIDLDTPVTRYSPLRILDGDPRLDLITARHVLSHSSGLQNWRSEREPLKIHFTPGEQYLYSGEGYSYLQSVVTQLTGHVDPRPSDRFRLQKRTIAEMVRPHIKGGESPASSRALGWEVVHTGKDDFILHGGDNPGFHAFAAASLERKTGYIFMTNGDGGIDLLKKLIVGNTTLNRLLIG
jgi:CubicO group peptidase (beta-lactamase class C family)